MDFKEVETKWLKNGKSKDLYVADSGDGEKIYFK